MIKVLLIVISVLFIMNFSPARCSNAYLESERANFAEIDSVCRLDNKGYLINLIENPYYVLKTFASLISRTDDYIYIPIILLFYDKACQKSHVNSRKSNNPASFYSKPDAADRFGYDITYIRFSRTQKKYEIEQFLTYDKDGKGVDYFVVPEEKRSEEPVAEDDVFNEIWGFLHRKEKIKVGSEIMEMYADEILPTIKTTDYEVLESRTVPY